MYTVFMFGMSIKRMVITLILAIFLHFVAGVVNCCLGGCQVNTTPLTNSQCITTGRPVKLCLDKDYRILLIEIYLINIFFWWLSVNAVVFLGQQINWKKYGKYVFRK